MKKFFTEMPKSDRLMLLVWILITSFIGAMLGGVAYATNLPLWLCLIIGLFLPVLVTIIQLFFLIVLYRKSKECGTPRESMSDSAVPEKPMTKSEELHPIAYLIMGAALGDMASRAE